MHFKEYKKDFPILADLSHGKPLVYLDSAASSQKPHVVIKAMNDYYAHDHANIHRGVYELSERATHLYEAARVQVRDFIHAKSSKEIIFVRGATEAINLVANSFGRKLLQPGDEILLTMMEHHSNIVPWQMVAQDTGAVIKVIPVSKAGELENLANFATYFSKKTRLLAITHASNVLGTINPIQKITALAHAHGISVLVDGAQAVPHLPVDVQALDCDFYVFSSHKMYGPTGIGVLYGKEKWLTAMPPWQGGGDMIERVSFTGTTYAPLPAKFEAGTPAIAEAIGLSAAINYLQKIGMENIAQHEQHLLSIANQLLEKVKGLQIIGTAAEKVGVISFVMEGVHPHDIATILDHEGIAVRAGHHCAMPLMTHLGLPACTRLSFGLYTTESDIVTFVQGLDAVRRIFN